jgi:hypothetical protein
MAVDPRPSEDDAISRARKEVLAHMDRLETRAPRRRLAALYQFLADIPWPYPELGDGVEDFAEAARRGLRRVDGRDEWEGR